MIDETESTAVIEVDGGISAHNSRLLFDAGADALVAGSAVFGVIADPCSYRLPQLPDGWKGFAAKSLREPPLSAWLD